MDLDLDLDSAPTPIDPWERRAQRFTALVLLAFVEARQATTGGGDVGRVSFGAVGTPSRAEAGTRRRDVRPPRSC